MIIRPVEAISGMSSVDRFTSTGLVSLLIRAIEEADPALLAGVARPDPMDHATEPDGIKHTLVERVMARHGPGLLLSVGDYLPMADEMPVLTVLTRSAEPGVLAEKWMRLERYYHASHRTEIHSPAPDCWHCRRWSTDAAASTGENCLIAGVLLGLLRAVGQVDCRFDIDGRVIRPAELKAIALPSTLSFQVFGIRWTTAGSATNDMPITGGAPDLKAAMADGLADLLAADMGRSWKLDDAARALALSGRSLQRRLGAEGKRFSGVLRRARMRQATELLTRSDFPLAVIGYCCGYADQAHFQRDFLRATNITPGEFRRIAGDNGGPGSKR